MTQLGVLDLSVAATVAAGNWTRFSYFAWFRQSELKRPEDWAVIYHCHRDSGLLDQSNAAFIDKAMSPFSDGDDPDVVFESHYHWAVGHIDGFSVRVFESGRVTKAFRTYHDLAVRMDEYPILDESDYSQREFDATYENLNDAAWRVRNDFKLPDDWQSQVFNWLSENNSGELENRDDQGGYPSEVALATCFESLGFQQAA